jgi:hypothetical protein
MIWLKEIWLDHNGPGTALLTVIDRHELLDLCSFG